jgi:P63C domain
MATKIVSVLTAQELIELFRREAKIGADGSVGFSRRGIARLVGKSLSRIQLLLKKCSDPNSTKKTLSESLEPFVGGSFVNDPQVSDIVVTAIISHYAELGDARCFRLLRSFGAIGLRASVHQAQCWASDRSTNDTLKLKYLQPTPRTWDKQFPDEFYSHLARLTNHQIEGSKRPQYWAGLTNELVYDYLPLEIGEGVKAAKLVNASYDRLHQFLKPDGLVLLQNHLNALIILMSGASSIEELRKSSIGRFSGSYQLALRLQ